jgi:AraC-like DNA-binding protein
MCPTFALLKHIMEIEVLPLQQLRLLETAIVFSNPDPWVWRTVNRDHYNLWICMEGRGRMRCGVETYDILPWTAFVLPPDVEVSAESDSSGVPLRNFSAHWLPVETAVPFSDYSLFGISLREVDTVQGHIQSLLRLSVHNDMLSKQQSEWIVLQLLALIWREVQTPQESSVDALLYRQIERMRSGEDLFCSVEALAAEVNLSRIHYSRCFRRLTGEAPNQYLIRQRVERACVLLRETDWTIEVLANMIGYSDVYFFSRQFKHVMKMTPSQYRNVTDE